jgi:ACS family glucarate transporter-like MFS transporter
MSEEGIARHLPREFCHYARVPTTSRRSIILLLSGFSLMAYVLRMNISVASPFMMAELNLDKIQMGRVFSAFMLGYALFQVPWGVSGDRLGPGRILTWAAIAWTLTTLLTGLLPGWIVPAGTASLGMLIALRFLLGASQAAAYPVASRAISGWLPASQRALSFSALIVAMAFGSAFTPPLVSWAMSTFGWRMSFYICAVVALGLAVAWRRLAGSQLDTAITGPANNTRSTQAWWAPLKDSRVSLLSLSYFFNSYVLFVFVFWLYLYLVEQRGMSILSGGVYTSIPFVLAMFFVPAAGVICDRLSIRYGPTVGRRVVAMTALVSSALFLVLGVDVVDQDLAIAGLSLAVAFLLCTEVAYWSASMDVGGDSAGTVGGIMNMAGNLGGVVSTALVPILVSWWGWPFAFQSAAGLSIVAAVLWVFVKMEHDGLQETPRHGETQA